MVKIVDKQNIFNHGILSPKLYSRDDLKQFNGGIADALNFICSRYGPMEKRTGTQFIWDLNNPSEKVFFLPFIFSVKQSVLLEFLEHRIRFYTFDGREFGPIAMAGITWQANNGKILFSRLDYGDIGWFDSVYNDAGFTSRFGEVSGSGQETTNVTTQHIHCTNKALNISSSFGQAFDEVGIENEILTAQQGITRFSAKPVGEDMNLRIVDGKLYNFKWYPGELLDGRTKWTAIEPNYGICDGRLYQVTDESGKYFIEPIGDMTGWTEISHRQNNTLNQHAFGICNGRLYSICNKVVTEIGAGIATSGWSKLGCGGYDYSTAYHYAICNAKLYAINYATGEAVVTQVGSHIGWTFIVDSSDTSNNQPDYAYGICNGNLWALRGTTATQVGNLSTWTTVSEGSYTLSGYGRPSVGIAGGALYLLYGTSAYLIDNTRNWTHVTGYPTGDCNAIADGKLYYIEMDEVTGTPDVSNITLTETNSDYITWTDMVRGMALANDTAWYEVEGWSNSPLYIDDIQWYSSLTGGVVDTDDARYALSITGVPADGDMITLAYSTTVISAPYITVSGVKYYRRAVQYEIETPFTAEQLEDISYVQSLDVVYLAFGDRKTPPYTLSRYANNNWRLALFETEDGPYLDKNYSTTKKMTIADKNTDTSTINLTGFTLGAADVGRWIRICTPRYNENTFTYEDKWSYGKIATVAANGASITVTWSYRNIVNEEDQAWMTAATSEWRLGVWHTGTGNNDYPVTYPTKVTIHQQRLTWSGLTDKPWVWTSNSFAYKNYAPSDYEGEISDTNSIYYDISTDKVSDIFWLKSVKSLLIGTELGELRMYSAGTAITPSDVVSNRESSYGSFNAEPIVNEDNIVFIQRLQRTLRSLSYDYNQDAFVGPELTILAEGLTTGGIKKVVFQKEPNNTYWCLKEDGTLLTLTYDKSQDVIGWSKSTLAGEDVKVIDLTVLPSNDNGQDMVLFAVERNIGGMTRRYLELLSRNFIRDIEHKDASFLDCSTHLVSDTPFNVIDGLDFLEEQTVRVMDEGSYLGDYKVEAGRILLDTDCKDVIVGLPYDAYFETLERDLQDRQLSTKMSKLRIYKIHMYIDRTMGVSLYRLAHGSETFLTTFNPANNMDTTSELITGKVEIDVHSNWECDYRLRITSEPGLPCTIAGLILGVEINAI